VVVHCAPEVQLERLMRRNSLSREEALQRIEAQMPQAEKMKYADYLVDTSGTLDETRRRVEEVWRELEQVAG
jgi:dephospho-CoA kinase